MTEGDRRVRGSVLACVKCLPLWGAILLVSCASDNHRLTAAQIAVLKKEHFQQKGDDWELALASKVLFDIDADQIKPPTQEAIARTGSALQSVQINRLRVEGYTDNTGSAEHNLALSQRRASAVAQALGSNGLAGGHIETKGLGMLNPVADNATEAGRAENRRVAIIVPSQQD